MVLAWRMAADNYESLKLVLSSGSFATQLEIIHDHTQHVRDRKSPFAADVHPFDFIYHFRILREDNSEICKSCNHM
jgi:hypothetical protein